MSLFPLNVTQFKDWSIQQLYYLLYPYIKEDFMGRQDCQAVHQEPNMTVVVGGATIPVTHVLRGGSDALAAAKVGEYRLLTEEGRIVTEAAELTGQFTGIAR